MSVEFQEIYLGNLERRKHRSGGRRGGIDENVILILILKERKRNATCNALIVNILFLQNNSPVVYLQYSLFKASTKFLFFHIY